MVRCAPASDEAPQAGAELAERKKIGGHDDLTFMTSAPQHHGAFWHFPPRRARSLKARANHATHPTPRARESIGYVSVVITTYVTFNENMHEGRRVRVRRFELAPLALRKEVATWNRNRQKKNDRRSTREGARRGMAGVMRAVAAVRTFGLCGT